MDWSGLFASLKNKRVTVIGDIICDLYISTQPSRISREAPVLILDYLEERIVPGGAANVAFNLQALGLEVTLLGWLGQDQEGQKIHQELAQKGLDVSKLFFCQEQTVTKTRILAGGQSQLIKQQVLRLDKGQPLREQKRKIASFLTDLPELLNTSQALIFSDYGYGSVCQELVKASLLWKEKHSLFLAGDSRDKLELFKDFDLLTPNEVEAKFYSKKNDIIKVGQDILEALRPKSLLITRGGLGMLLLRPGLETLSVPALGFTPIADVSGAGDTVIAALTAGRLAGLDWPLAARFASLAAAVVVRKAGTAVALPEEIIALGEKEDKS